MKLVDHFKTFLNDEVNLNKTRFDQLNDSVEAVKSILKGASWGAKILDFVAQGSWAHGTIIKPLPDGEFDADLLLIVDPVDSWEPKDYLNKLGAFFESHSTYGDMVRRYSHCITIEYAGERRIDLTPCIRGRIYTDSYEVCNRTANTYELSASLAYTEWVNGKNAIAGGDDLRKVTRLLKYLRDIKTNFTCPSFLFTTLVGYRIFDSDKGTPTFADTPTCLKEIVGRLDNWLQQNLSLPEIRNPVLPFDIQSRVWNETQYSNFRDKINLYRGWIDDAYNEEDRDESIGKWQRVFGEAFAAGEARNAARISESAAKSTALVSAGHFVDLVDLVKTRGQEAVPSRITRLPYIQRPKWRLSSQQYTVLVSTELLASRNGVHIRSISSLEPLQKGLAIRFTAKNSVGVPFLKEFSVEWRVTNTDQAAYNADALRGSFYKSDSGSCRTEELAYRGVHFVEAFVIKKSDNRLCGKSEPFYVVIE